MTRPLVAPSSVVSLTRVAAWVGRLRRLDPDVRIALANGLFELLHVGHLRYLRGARRLADYLVVAINDDRSARRLRGPGRPIVPARQRARLVAALRPVDAVLLFGEPTVTRVLTRLRPEFHCKGTDYLPGTVPERLIVRAYGGTTRISGDPKRHASSDLLARIRRRWKAPPKRQRGKRRFPRLSSRPGSNPRRRRR